MVSVQRRGIWQSHRYHEACGRLLHERPDRWNGKKRLTLQEEALKDLVRFFADAGNMDDAYAYFNRLGKKDLIQQMLKRLASMYFEQGKFDLSITTYRRLIRENPNSPKAPDYQNEIILAYQKTGRKQETLDEIRVLLDQYGKQSAWARSNASNPDAIRAASTFVEQNLRTVAQNYQIEADKLGQVVERLKPMLWPKQHTPSIFKSSQKENTPTTCAMHTASCCTNSRSSTRPTTNM